MKNGTANVLVNGTEQIEQLASTDLKQEVLQQDVAALDRRARRADVAARGDVGARAAGLPSGRTTYRTYESIQAELKDLADKNPTLVRPVSIGKSFEGRDVTGIEVANDVKGTDGRPVFFLMGIHHAREWPAAEAAMEYAQTLVKLKDDPTYAKLLATERVVIVPLVNPDGYIVSRDAFSPGDTLGGDENITLVEAIAPPGGFGAYRRKNCNPVMGPATSCEAAIGVDPNRNYGNLWGGSGGSPDPTSQAFHGLSPRSEVETRNVYDYARTHHVTTLVSVHTVAGLVLRPPGLAQLGLAPDENRMKEIGDAMGAAAGYQSQFSWQLYDTAGTTEDDTYAATGGYGYTIEMGPSDGGFHGPYKDNVIDQWTGDYAPAKGGGGLAKALTLAAQAAATPKDHALFKGTAPAGKVLRLKKAFDTLTSEYCRVGAEPVIDPTALVDPTLPPAQACPEGVQPAITLKDTLDTTTTVPSGGAFEWHVGQSTRPFVGGGATLITAETVSPAIYDADGTAATPGTATDVPFTIPAGVDQARITVTAKVPADDFDIEVFRKEGTALTSVGTSGQSAPSDEVVSLNPAPAGTYVLRVTNFAALGGGFHATVSGQRQKRTITTGTTEAYTLTCEDPDGTVLETRELTIARGQQVVADLGCGTRASTVSAPGPQDEVLPSPAGTAAGGSTPAVGGTTTPAKPSTTSVLRRFTSSAAVDFTSIKRARKEGLRVRLKASGAYSASIRLLDAKGRTLARRTLAKLSGRRTIRVKSARIASVRTVKVTITELATRKTKAYTLRKALK